MQLTIEKEFECQKQVPSDTELDAAFEGCNSSKNIWKTLLGNPLVLDALNFLAAISSSKAVRSRFYPRPHKATRHRTDWLATSMHHSFMGALTVLLQSLCKAQCAEVWPHQSRAHKAQEGKEKSLCDMYNIARPTEYAGRSSPSYQRLRCVQNSTPL
jgi:hypothetical protein